MALGALSHLRPKNQGARRVVGLAVPILFGAFLFFLWEVIVVGARRAFGAHARTVRDRGSLHGLSPTLRDDFVQTFVKSVLSGYIMGCLSGFVVAIVADRIPFLRRGLLPLGNFVSALADDRNRADHGDVVRLRLAL